MLEVIGSWWHLSLTFWPWELYAYFSNLGYIFWMTLPSNFIFSFRDTSSEYLTHSLVWRSLVQGQGDSSEKAVACNSETTGWKLLGIDWNICHDNAQSNSELLTFWHWPLNDLETYFHTFSIQALSFECVKIAALFLVWRYIFRISRSPSSFKVMALISRSRSQNSISTQVCAPLGYSLILLLFCSFCILMNKFNVCLPSKGCLCFHPYLMW